MKLRTPLRLSTFFSCPLTLYRDVSSHGRLSGSFHGRCRSKNYRNSGIRADGTRLHFRKYTYSPYNGMVETNKLESTQRVQTSAEDFLVLLLAVYRNRNSKKSFKIPVSGSRDRGSGLRTEQPPESNRLVLMPHPAPPKIHQNRFITFLSNLADRQTERQTNKQTDKQTLVKT